MVHKDVSHTFASLVAAFINYFDMFKSARARTQMQMQTAQRVKSVLIKVFDTLARTSNGQLFLTEYTSEAAIIERDQAEKQREKYIEENGSYWGDGNPSSKRVYSTFKEDAERERKEQKKARREKRRKSVAAAANVQSGTYYLPAEAVYDPIGYQQRKQRERETAMLAQWL
jgi:hypothetical protein